jgi:hypothetical protein
MDTTMSGGSPVVLEDIRRMTEVLVFCAEVTAFMVTGLFFHRLVRGR